MRSADDLVVVGEFRSVDDDTDISTCVDIADTGFIALGELKSRLKSKSESLNQFYQGDEISRQETYTHHVLSYQFNSDCFSWHYGWKGNRYKQKIRHVFMVSLLIPQTFKLDINKYNQMEKLVLKGQYYSPSFCVLSLRRRMAALTTKTMQELTSSSSNTNQQPIELSQSLFAVFRYPLCDSFIGPKIHDVDYCPEDDDEPKDRIESKMEEVTILSMSSEMLSEDKPIEFKPSAPENLLMIYCYNIEKFGVKS